MKEVSIDHILLDLLYPKDEATLLHHLVSFELYNFLQSVAWEQVIADPDIRSVCVSIKKTADTLTGGTDLSTAMRIKLVVVGDGAVGKTCLLISYSSDRFPVDYVPTVFENYTAQMKLNDEAVLLHLWDTAGQEEYDRLRPLSYPGADLIFLCFSLVHKPSYDAIKIKWFPEVKHYIPNVPHVLVGTKLDLREHFQQNPSSDHELVTTEMGQALSDELKSLKYVEVSAKTKQNLDTLFHDAVSSVLEIKRLTNEVPTSSSTSSSTSPGVKASSSSSPSNPAVEHIVRQKKEKQKGCSLL